LRVLRACYRIQNLFSLNTLPGVRGQMKTYNATNETAQHNWYIVDAANKTLGRLASEVAKRLRGKHKPEYTPNVDTGDYIIVINAAQIKITGNKAKDKVYYHHTGYPGGIKEINFEKLLAKNPMQVIEKAVKGMLPKNPLGRAMYLKLKVYAGIEHPHQAQQPQLLALETE
jgi:large subunit ribosomal protein L13